MSNIQMYVRIRVHDKDGNLVHDHQEESRSLVKAFLAGLLGSMGNITGGLSATHNDIAGAGKTISESGATNLVLFKAVGAVNDDTNGIIIGTTNTAVDITDEKLVAAISDGTSSGEMLFGAQTYDTDITISDPDATFLTSRTFTNSSGGSITVRETGIYGEIEDTTNSPFDFCIVRDVPSPVTVSNGSTCTVDYTFKISE